MSVAEQKKEAIYWKFPHLWDNDCQVVRQIGKNEKDNRNTSKD